jgi:hypothetical protein
MSDVSIFWAVVAGAAIGSVINQTINVFTQRFIAKPLDKQLERITNNVLEALKKMDEKEERDFSSVEKEVLKLKECRKN